ncbi:hypothetical protein PCL_11120 [Purpureocillium lilacinum]|uniref:Uncharacterized protein n=1 Tax=Purpureocillium lilacinum TaxID=33203 RepID=A0A2U3EDA5_PURLI|nr:hypothetical protein PCL_11120 [Purpureocillium lilacinum]
MATLKAGGSDRQLARRKRRRESAEKKVRVRVGLAGSHLPGMLLAHSTPAVARRPRARGMHTKSAVRWALDTEALTCHLRTATNTRPPTTLEALERGAWPGGSWAGLSLLAAPCRGIEAFELPPERRVDIWICALASLLAWADRQAKGDACVMQMFVSEERVCVQGRAEMDLILRCVYGARMGFGLERAAGELLGCAAGLAPGVEDGPRGQIRCNNLAPLYLEVGASTRGTSGQDLPTRPTPCVTIPSPLEPRVLCDLHGRLRIVDELLAKTRIAVARGRIPWQRVSVLRTDRQYCSPGARRNRPVPPKLNWHLVAFYVQAGNPRAGHVRDTYQDRDNYHKDPRLSSPSPCPSPLRHQSDPALVKMLLVMWPHIRPEAACTDRLVSLDRAAQREGNSNWGISQQRPRHRSSSWESANRGSHSVFVIELDQEDAKPCRWREAPASLVHWRGRRLGNEQATFSEALLRSFVPCKACSDTVHVVKRNDEAQQQEKKQQQALSSTSIITPSDALWRK